MTISVHIKLKEDFITSCEYFIIIFIKIIFVLFLCIKNIFYNEKIELQYVCVFKGVRRGAHYVLVWELLAFP